MQLDKKQIDNLYAMATSSKLEKKLHHRYVPIMMFAANGQEVILPMVCCSNREIKECEEEAELETKNKLGEVALINRGKGSTWQRVYDDNRSAWLIYTCTRMPGDLKKKFFESKQQVEDTYDEDELGVLMDHYNTVRYSSPTYTIFEDEIDEKVAFQNVIEKIKKMGTESDFFLNSLTTHDSNQLIKFLVLGPTNYKNISGTSGTPSNNTSPTE